MLKVETEAVSVKNKRIVHFLKIRWLYCKHTFYRSTYFLSNNNNNKKKREFAMLSSLVKQHHARQQARKEIQGLLCYLFAPINHWILFERFMLLFSSWLRSVTWIFQTIQYFHIIYLLRFLIIRRRKGKKKK